MKQWIKKAKEYLTQSLGKVPQVLNELDWKEALPPKNEKLCQHICAFANVPGGYNLVFGRNSKNASLAGLAKEEANRTVQRLSPELGLINRSRALFDPNPDAIAN